MIEVFQAAAQVQRVCLDAGWGFCFIGALALQRWGEPRFTRDADVTLFTGFGQEQHYIEILLCHFQARIADPVAFALKHRVLLLRSDNGVGIDIALGGLAFEAEAVQRASDFVFPPDIRLHTCSAEDLIIMKAFADRGQDWVDVERVIIRQSGKLDWSYIYRQLPPLLELKEAPEVLDRLAKLRVDCERE